MPADDSIAVRLTCRSAGGQVTSYSGRVLELRGKAMSVLLGERIEPGISLTGTCSLLPGPTIMRLTNIGPSEAEPGSFVAELSLLLAPKTTGREAPADVARSAAAAAARRLSQALPGATLAQAFRGGEQLPEQLQAVAAAVLHLLERRGLVNLDALLGDGLTAAEDR